MYRTLLKCVSTLQVEKALGSLLTFHQVDFSICFKLMISLKIPLQACSSGASTKSPISSSREVRCKSVGQEAGQGWLSRKHVGRSKGSKSIQDHQSEVQQVQPFLKDTGSKKSEIQTLLKFHLSLKRIHQILRSCISLCRFKNDSSHTRKKRLQELRV